MTTNETDHFDENSQKYYCCCGHCHSLTGVKIIAAFMVLGVITQGNLLFSTGDIVERLFDSSFTFILSVTIAACTIYALYSGKAIYLIPAMILQLLSTILLIISIPLIVLFDKHVYKTLTRLIIAFAKYLNDTDLDRETKLQYRVLFGFVVCLVGIPLEIWCFLVLRSAYRYLKDKSSYKSVQTNMEIIASSSV